MERLYDFNKGYNPPFIIGHSRELAWPFRLIRIIIPKSSHNSREGLNAFEFCILKLLACGIYKPEDLAKEICLSVDMVNIILSRLIDKGKIDEIYQLNPDTLNDIEKIDSEKEYEPSEFETRVLFQDCISGELLPAIKEPGLQAEEVLKNNSEYICILKEFKLWKLPPNPKYFKDDDRNLPTPKDILSFFRRYNLIGKIYHNTSEKNIVVSNNSEPCYLRVRMVVLNNSNSDWRILNPFGKDYAPKLDEHYVPILESAYLNLMTKNKSVRSDFIKWEQKQIDANLQQKEDKKQMLPYETPDNEKLYPELIGALKRGERINRNGEKRGADVYSVIEWALFYALKNCESTNKQLQLMMVDAYENNELHIQEAINNLNISQDINNRIHAPNPKMLEGFQKNGTADMNVVLPLALLVSYNDPYFSFNKVCQNNKNVLSIIQDILKNRRNKDTHGETNYSKVYDESEYAFMNNVVTTLFPSIRFSDASSDNELTSDSEDKSVSNLRLKAKCNLHDKFDVYLFDKMDNVLQGKLWDVEFFRCANDADEFDALPCIEKLYGATQRAFCLLLDGRSISISISNAVSAAQQRAKDAGFGDFPESLLTPRQKLLQYALEGNAQSLGTSIIAWLLKTEIRVLKMIARRLSDYKKISNDQIDIIPPEFLLPLNDLIDKREHANRITIMRKEELNALIDKIYRIIKTIMEA
ncbi:MAG: hypothetical protein IKX40_03345 [Thermoguttaceae bacterium]|nr:hypothetical protein [Thermoguttaceae bacterium]